VPPNRFRSVLVALLIAWVSMVAYALSGLMSEKVSSEDRHFAEDIDSIVGELKNKLDTNEAVLAGFAAFLQAVDRSDVEATARYASLAIAAYPHIYMMEVARKVPLAEQDHLENTLRKEWRPDFALKDFRSITHRPAVDAPKRAFTWPILFMYPALPEAAEIHGVRLETVDYLGLSLASAEGKAKPVASPVFNLYEGGNAYILLQEAIRNPVRASGTDLNFFGNTMAAMLLIKGQSLVPSRLDSAGHKYIHVSAWMDSAAGLGDPLFDHQAHEASLLDKLLLPSFERRLTVNNASQPIALQFERQLLWRDLLTENVPAKALLLLLAFFVVPWLIVRHYRTLNSLALEHERVAYLATHDQLTDLPNRFLLADRFTQAFHNWERNAGAFAILILDLDHFKEINDTCGHEVGDQVLVAAARRMTAELRSCDTVARYGGDEFAVLLVTDASIEKVSKVGEKLLEAMSDPVATSAGQMNVSCSIGIAVCPTHGKTLDELKRAADKAMYRAKSDGRNRVSVYAIEGS